MKLHGFIFTGICLGLYYGCAKPTVQRVLPPLPSQTMFRTKGLPPVAKLLTPQPSKITLGWDNSPSPFSTNWETGLEGTTNFRSWYEVASLSYTTQAVVALSNRPPEREFYRAFNRIKPSAAAGAMLPPMPLSPPVYVQRQPERPG